MSYEDDRDIKIRLMEIIDEWTEENGLESSPHMDADLAEMIFQRMIWCEGEPGHEEYHIKPKEESAGS